MMKLDSYDFPPRQDADAYISALYHTLLSWITIALICMLIFPIFSPEYWPVVLSFEGVAWPAAALLFLWYRNTLLCIVSDDAFVYRTFLGNIYRFRFSEITAINHGIAGIQIVFPNKKILIDASAIVSKKLKSKLQEAQKRIGNPPDTEPKTASEKTDMLRKRFRDR